MDSNGGEAAGEFDKMAFRLTSTSSSAHCDINRDSQVNAVDVQLLANAVLSGSSDLSKDLNTDGAVNAIDVQILVNAILGVSSCP